MLSIIKRLGSGFGVRAEQFHWGQDFILATEGVQAVSGGRVSSTGFVGASSTCDTGRGVTVIADNEGKKVTYYYGNVKPSVKIGQEVEKGTQIGTVFPNRMIHLEVREGDEYVNPLNHLNESKPNPVLLAQKTLNAYEGVTLVEDGVLGRKTKSRLTRVTNMLTKENIAIPDTLKGLDNE